MQASEHNPSSLTPQDVRDIAGDLDDAKIAAILATGANAEKRCVPSASVLAQWEHRRAQCTRVVISSTETESVIHYTCPDGGFGHSKVRVITPRTLRIETQGISGGFPFNYVLHARRVGDCPTSLRSRLTGKG